MFSHHPVNVVIFSFFLFFPSFIFIMTSSRVVLTDTKGNIRCYSERGVMVVPSCSFAGAPPVLFIYSFIFVWRWQIQLGILGLLPLSIMFDRTSSCARSVAKLTPNKVIHFNSCDFALEGKQSLSDFVTKKDQYNVTEAGSCYFQVRKVC